ncbi:craniofacial development protein 2-like [Palaemon carinicauda]|uniref:craniofacial development protein 2-like n=1 Tax=Palaemon carinicauda TaxID=392227 RepID=UPI0035B63B41
MRIGKRRGVGTSPDPSEKSARATQSWAGLVIEASSEDESSNSECGDNDWKTARDGWPHGEKEDWSAVCVQETRWKGNNARELGEGCKLYYSGANMEGTNGIGVILSKELKEKLIEVNRKDDRFVSLKLGLGATMVNVVCAYAPQTGCTEEKDTFWEMDQELRIIPTKESVIIGGDLNGHMRISRDGTPKSASFGVDVTIPSSLNPDFSVTICPKKKSSLASEASAVMEFHMLLHSLDQSGIQYHHIPNDQDLFIPE